MTSDFNYKDSYLQYLQQVSPDIGADTISHVGVILENTSWDSPSSSLDCNNLAVVALIEAENCDDNLAMRSIYLDMAFEALNNGVNLDGHPLCAAHLALLHSMIGEPDKAMEIAFTRLVDTLHHAYTTSETLPTGLIYLYRRQRSCAGKEYEHLEKIITSKDGYQQASLLLNEVLCLSALVFYDAGGIRLLNLANQLLPNSVSLGVRLGVSSLMAGQWEGLLYLYRARELSPDSAPVVQALYLAYRDLQQIELANYWLEVGKEFYQQHPNSLDWKWSELAADNEITYLSFASNLIIAVEPSFRSIVTSVLISEGDWFEKEMEFWRTWIQPGMTVIDVGANVGVYTFSAALQVGSEGRVLAVEPFSGCVNCLEETCRINQLSWVKVCPGAASDHNGIAKISLYAASELNEIIANEIAEKMQPGTFEEVSCFTLDSLVDQEKLNQVDFLKIDAEGHELQVLAGSERILNDFAPIIMYENIAGSKGSNLPVAEFLVSRGYELFRYKPYLQQLIPINSEADLYGSLNIIALPPSQEA
ncbi:MAG: FkbM family methyltransferase [Nostocaceae cyanobacterium]|nr:FkbM family methyltransferase [Nostocaceae cyanobacterium]